jgi:hypothetical protein
MHQLVFNVQDKVRTEAIAGWYLRVQSAQEFKLVGKSLNVFWLPTEARALTRPRPGESYRLEGRIDENTDFALAGKSSVIDLRDVSAVTSRGLIRWLEFVRSLEGKGAEIVALPDPLLLQATAVAGVLRGLTVRSVLAPFECLACGFEERRELPPDAILAAPGGACPDCKATMQFAGVPAVYQSFLGILKRDHA